MRMHTAYKIMNSDTDKVVSLVWWDGSSIKCSSEHSLRGLKQHIVDGLTYADGKAFFDKIPSIYKSGYTYAEKTEVDENGKLVHD